MFTNNQVQLYQDTITGSSHTQHGSETEKERSIDLIASTMNNTLSGMEELRGLYSIHNFTNQENVQDSRVYGQLHAVVGINSVASEENEVTNTDQLRVQLQREFQQQLQSFKEEQAATENARYEVMMTNYDRTSMQFGAHLENPPNQLMSPHVNYSTNP